jgi:hypothetical protein
MICTKRKRLKPDLNQQLKLRMNELGFHPDQHMHLGELTWLFTHREWVLVTKKDNTGVTIYPSDKTLADVVSELGDW